MAGTEGAEARDRGSDSARRTVVASQAEVGEVNRDGNYGYSAAAAGAVAAAGNMAAAVAGMGRQEVGTAPRPPEERGRPEAHMAAGRLPRPEAGMGCMRAEEAEVVAAAQRVEAAAEVGSAAEVDVDAVAAAAAAANYDFAGFHTHSSHTKQTGRPGVLRWQPEPPALPQAIGEHCRPEQLLCVELPRLRPSMRNSLAVLAEEGEDLEAEEVAGGYTQQS